MKISVVVPSLNSGRYIREAVESALGQSGPEVEVVVQDGESSDQTLSVLDAIGDPRVQVLSEPDDGQADALNRAIARASGDWIVWLNADDVLAPGAFEAVEHLLDGPYDLVYGDFEVIDSDSRVLKSYTSSDLDARRLLTRGLYVFSGTWLVRREVYADFGGYDADLGFAMDYDFLLRIAPHVRSVHARRTLARFREQPESKTSRRVWRFFRESAAVRRRHGGFRGARAVPTAGRQLAEGAYLLSRPLWTSAGFRRALPRQRR